MSGFRVGRIAGIDLRVHPSWFIIVLLVIWMLGWTVLPSDFPDVASSVRLLMAGGITVGFFLSLLAHELAHSVIAMARGIPVHRITFFLFGGMAETSRDSRSPGEEFIIAVAGPVMSLLLAFLFIGLWWLGAESGSSPALVGSLGYLAVLNLVLAVFNLLPGFPMDGGRILRSALWAATGNAVLATRWAARVGEAMALLLIGYGVWRAVRGEFMAGTWLALIGLFIRHAARTSYEQYLLGRVREAVLHAQQAGSHGDAS